MNNDNHNNNGANNGDEKNWDKDEKCHCGCDNCLQSKGECECGCEDCTCNAQPKGHCCD